MSAIEMLREERRLARSMADRLEELVERWEESGRLDAEAARRATFLLLAFVDRGHFGKEEGILLPLLGERGLSPELGVLASLRCQIGECRWYLRSLDPVSEAVARRLPGADRHFAETARACVRLLRTAVDRSSRCVHRAEQVLLEEDHARLARAFEAHDARWLEPGLVQACRSFARTPERRHAQRRPGPPSAAYAGRPRPARAPQLPAPGLPR